MREAVAVGLFACAALLIVGQWIAIASAVRSGRPYSALSFIGAVLGSSGALVSGWPHAVWSDPLFIISDPGCIAVLRLGIRGLFR